MLAVVHGLGYLFRLDGEMSRELSLSYARRAVAADSSNHLAFYSLALAHSCLKEIPAFRNAAERALALELLWMEASRPISACGPLTAASGSVAAAWLNAR